VLARDPLSIDDCALYPLFDDELLALMRRVISPDKEHAVGVAVIFRARRGKKKIAVTEILRYAAFTNDPAGQTGRRRTRRLRAGRDHDARDRR
jgi:hypothetical protein